MIKNTKQKISTAYFAGFVAVSTITAILYFILNSKSGYVIDDFNYSFIFEQWRISRSPVLLSSLSDIYEGMVTHYLVWSGRIPVHTVAQILLMFDKSLFNVLNTLMVVLLGILVYFHVNYGRKHSFAVYLLLHVMIYFFIPTPDQTILFLTGAINYLWVCVYLLLFLLPFRIYSERTTDFRHAALLTVGMIPFGFFAGWSNEPGAAGAALMIIISSALLLKRKMKIPLWFYSAFAALAVGFSIMVLAPGYRKKAGDLHSADNIIIYALKHIGEITSQIFSRSFSALWPLFVLLGALLYTIIKIRKVNNAKLPKKHRQKVKFIQSFEFKDTVLASASYFMCAAAGICMYLISPEFELRYLFSPAVFFIISAGILMSAIENELVIKDKARRAAAWVLIAFSIVIIPFDFKNEYSILSHNFAIQTYFEQEIYTQVSRGQKDVVITGKYSFQTGGKFSLYHTGNFGLSVLWGGKEPDYETNRILAAYFGADTYINDAELDFIGPNSQ